MKDSEFKPVEELTYTQALAELESILRTIQSENCDIDILSILTRRASALLESCRNRLTATETELRSILSDLEKQ
ncbi:MAG: exodeoxyribonuclease VII small subunit [Muribaculaceae bacterium]|nr:exodeoxyribonuclease VII small subunit [Muribaculaceae bacterium]